MDKRKANALLSIASLHTNVIRTNPLNLKMRPCLLLLVFINCISCQGSQNAKADQFNSQLNSNVIDSTTLKKQSISKKNWVHREKRYSDSLGSTIHIYSSLPRGGGYNKTGIKDGYRIFWNSIVNESASPLKLTLELPVDSFPIALSSSAYVKAMFPPNTMAPDKFELTDFGVNNIQSLLDNGFKKPSKLEIVIDPKEEYYYNTLFLFHETQGVARSSLVLRGQDLFYEISLDAQSPLIIPCGRVEISIKR